MSWIVFVGGSQSHIPFVQAAQGMGYKALVFDRYKDAPCKEEANVFSPISCHHPEEMWDFCSSFDTDEHQLWNPNIKGFITYCSHPDALIAKANLTSLYAKPGYSCETCLKMTDRERWKPLLSGTTPPYTVLESFHMKTVDGCGGVGVQRVDGVRILEETVYGPEFCINGYVQDSVGILAILRKYGKAQYIGAHRHIEEFTELADRVVKALKINHSFFAIDVIWNDGPHVIDVGLLLDCRVDELLAKYDKPPYEMAIQLATGTPVTPHELLDIGATL